MSKKNLLTEEDLTELIRQLYQVQRKLPHRLHGTIQDDPELLVSMAKGLLIKDRDRLRRRHSHHGG